MAPKKFVSISRREFCKNLMNISGNIAGLCWGTLLMIKEHSKPLFETECT